MSDAAGAGQERDGFADLARIHHLIRVLDAQHVLV